MICKHCLRPFPLLAIRGVRYRAVKKTRIPQRHIDVGAHEALLIQPIPLLVVKHNGSPSTRVVQSLENGRLAEPSLRDPLIREKG